MINIEATRMSMVSWARDNKFIHMFMKRPRATMPDVMRGRSNQYGSPATVAVIDHQTDLISDFVNDYCHTIWFDTMLDDYKKISKNPILLSSSAFIKDTAIGNFIQPAAVILTFSL